MKKRYILSYLDESQNATKINNIYDNIDKYQKMDIDTMSKKFDMKYVISLPDEYGAILYTPDIQNDSILTFKKLSSIIISYMDGVLPEKIENNIDNNEFDYYEYMEEILEQFVDNFLVIKVEKNSYSIVSLEKIISTFDDVKFSIMDDVIDDMANKNIINIDNFEEKFIKFTNVIDSKLLFDEDYLCATSSNNAMYEFTFFKENSTLYNELAPDMNPETLKPNHNGVIYECGYLDFKNFIKYNILIGNNIGITLSTKLLNQNMYKKYGFYIFNTEGKIGIKQLDANTLSKTYSTDVNTGEFKGYRPNEIYCGKDKNDIICGFDKI